MGVVFPTGSLVSHKEVLIAGDKSWMACVSDQKGFNCEHLTNTVEALLSCHPRGNGNWPLKRGRPLYRVRKKTNIVSLLQTLYECKRMKNEIAASMQNYNKLVF